MKQRPPPAHGVNAPIGRNQRRVLLHLVESGRTSISRLRTYVSDVSLWGMEARGFVKSANSIYEITEAGRAELKKFGNGRGE